MTVTSKGPRGGGGAVYVTGAPDAEGVDTAPQLGAGQDNVQLNPPPRGSLVRVAVICAVAPPATVAGDGTTLNWILHPI